MVVDLVVDVEIVNLAAIVVIAVVVVIVVVL